MAEEKGNFFVRRPIVAMVIAIVIVIVGGVSVIGLAIEQYPNLTPPVVEVRGTYVGANALNVEESVATPIEQEMNGVDNMIYMKSTNSNDGTMTIQVSFDVGTDPDMNTVLAQNRVSAATSKLPAAVTQYGVTTKKSMPNQLMLVTLTSDNPTHNNQEFLGNYALINIKDRLARIPGLGRMSWGLPTIPCGSGSNRTASPSWGSPFPRSSMPSTNKMSSCPGENSGQNQLLQVLSLPIP